MKQRKPWNPLWMLILLPLSGFIMNFVIAYLITGFNYTRLGKPERRKRMVRYALIGFIASFIIGVIMGIIHEIYHLPYEVSAYIIMIINAFIVVYLIKKQMVDYSEWKLKNEFK